MELWRLWKWEWQNDIVSLAVISKQSPCSCRKWFSKASLTKASSLDSLVACVDFTVVMRAYANHSLLSVSISHQARFYARRRTRTDPPVDVIRSRGIHLRLAKLERIEVKDPSFRSVGEKPFASKTDSVSLGKKTKLGNKTQSRAG
jgi:hypothetical protein